MDETFDIANEKNQQLMFDFCTSLVDDEMTDKDDCQMIQLWEWASKEGWANPIPEASFHDVAMQFVIRKNIMEKQIWGFNDGKLVAMKINFVWISS